MGFRDRIQDGVGRLSSGLGRLGKAILLEEVKAHMEEALPKLLEELGEERLKFLVTNDISLWQSSDEKKEALEAVSAQAGQIRLIAPEEAADLVQEVIKEKCPQYRWIPRAWIVQGFSEFRRDLA